MAKQDESAKKENKVVAEPTMEMGAMSQIRTLVAINNRKNLEGPLTHLERNYYQLHLVNRIPDLIKGLQIHRPQIVLLSWNLKNTDVKKVYRLLTQKFHLICIVFAEDSGTRTTASLMSSGIPDSLLAPVSGPSIHMRIQSKLAPRLRPRKRAVAPQDLFKKPVPVPAEKVPASLEWKDVTEKGNEKTWAGTSSAQEKETGGVYYFKGPNPPVYDKVKQEWNVGDKSKGGIFMQERGPASKEFSIVQEGLQGKEYKMTTNTASGEMMEATQSGPEPTTPLDNNFDWDAALKEAEDEISAVVKEAVETAAPEISQEKLDEKNLHFVHHNHENKKDPKGKKEEAKDSGLGNIIAISRDIHSRNPQAGESVLAQCLRAALTKFPGTAKQTVANEKTPVSKMTVCTVNSERFCGYMVCVSFDNKFQKEYMKELMFHLKEEMKMVGENISNTMSILEFEIGATPFGPWAESKADFTIASRKAGLSLAFFSTKGEPQVIEGQDESVLGIALDKDIVGDTPVLFNVYIHLPKNDKYLLYLNSGQVFTTSTIDKFLGYGVKTVFIRKTEKELFLTYCARNFINSSLK
jgi:hypothetical protein